MSEPLTPESASVNPEVGELTLGEMRAIESFRNTSEGVVREIGYLEVRKSQLLARIGQYEAQAQSVLHGAAQRLNIQQGEPWHVTPEGKVRRGSAQPPTSP